MDMPNSGWLALCRGATLLRFGLAMAASLLLATAAQADSTLGRTAYNTNCASCHSQRPGLTGYSAPPNMPNAPTGGATNHILNNFFDKNHLASVINNGYNTMGAQAVTPAAINNIYDYLVAVRDGTLTPLTITDFNNTVADGNSVSNSRSFTVANLRDTAMGVTVTPSANFAVLSTTCSSTPGIARDVGTCMVNIVFRPAIGVRGQVDESIKVQASGTALSADNGLNSAKLQTVQVSAVALAPAAISVTPPADGFPNTTARQSSDPRVWTIGNTGDDELVLDSVTSTAVTGTPAGTFNLGGTTCALGAPNLKKANPTSGQPAQTCTINAVFTPPTAGASFEVDVKVRYHGSRTPSTVLETVIQLKGNGVGTPALTLGASPTFPLTLVGHPVAAASTVSVTNNGTASATVTGVSITTGAFSQTNDCTMALAPFGNGTCRVAVTFLAGAVGSSPASQLRVAYGVASSAQTGLSATTTQLRADLAVTTGLVTPRTVPIVLPISLSNPSQVTTQLGSIALSGSNNFVITSNSCGASLAGGGVCPLQITFTPDTDASVSTSLVVRYGPVGQTTLESITVPISGSTQAIPLITVTPSSLTFPPTSPGTPSSPLFVDITNTGGAALSLSHIALTGNTPPDYAITANTCPASLAATTPPSSCRVTVTFTPSTQTTRLAGLTITHNATNGSTTVPLSGTTLLQATTTSSPTTLDFGSVVVNADSPLLASVLTNTGNIDLHLGTIAIGGSNPGDFSQVGSTCVSGATVTPASSCQVTVRFHPTASANRSASLQIPHDAAGSPVSVALTGIGVAVPAPDIQVNQSSLTFPSLVTQTTSPPQTINVRNAGTADLVISRIAANGATASDFGVAGTCAVGTPVVANGSCTVVVAFTPTGTGTRDAPLTIESNATRGTVSVALVATGLGTPAPVATVSPAAVAFGAQTVGSPYPPSTLQLQNTGTAVMNISGIAVSGLGFSQINNCSATLAVGGVCSIVVSFVPTTVGATYAGQVTIGSDGSGSPLVVALSGQGTVAIVPVLTWSPVVSALTFGDVATGNGSSVQSLTLKNASGAGGVTLNVVNAIGANAADFSVTGTCVPGLVLYNDQTCRIDVTFVPGSAGAKQATIQVASTGTRPSDVQLSGNGLGGPTSSLNVSTTAVSFEATRVGAQSLPVVVHLSSIGSGAVQVTSLGVSGPYAMQTNTCLQPPFTLQAGSDCTVTLTYQPQAAGSATGILSVRSDAGSGETTVALSGNGQAAADVSSGGCSMVSGESAADPTLWALVALAFAAVLYRHRQRQRGPRRANPSRERP